MDAFLVTECFVIVITCRVAAALSQVICKEAIFSVEGLLRIEQELRALTGEVKEGGDRDPQWSA